jgi:uncharacterized protein YgiB involved in biofilm formation
MHGRSQRQSSPHVQTLYITEQQLQQEQQSRAAQWWKLMAGFTLAGAVALWSQSQQSHAETKNENSSSAESQQQQQDGVAASGGEKEPVYFEFKYVRIEIGSETISEIV